jgi:hypothetical protein
MNAGENSNMVLSCIAPVVLHCPSTLANRANRTSHSPPCCQHVDEELNIGPATDWTQQCLKKPGTWKGAKSRVPSQDYSTDARITLLVEEIRKGVELSVPSQDYTTRLLRTQKWSK